MSRPGALRSPSLSNAPQTRRFYLHARVSFLLRAAVSVGLIVLLLTRVDLSAVGDTFRLANPALLAADFLIYLGAIALGTLKWELLCRAQGIEVGFFALLRSTFVSLFFGNFLPSNVGGDVVRAVDLSRETGRAEAASISVLVDRIIGLLVFVGSAAVTSLLALVLLSDQPEIAGIAFAASVLFLGILAVFVAMLSRRVSRAAGGLLRWLPQLNPLHATARRIYNALQVYRHARQALLWAALLSLAIQMLTTLVNYLLGLALGLPIPFIYYFLFNPLVAFVLLLPVSINGIGLKETIYVFFYTNVAGLVAREQSLSLSLAMHLLIVLAGMVGGAYLLAGRRARLTAR